MPPRLHSYHPPDVCRENDHKHKYFYNANDSEWWILKHDEAPSAYNVNLQCINNVSVNFLNFFLETILESKQMFDFNW